MPSQTPILFPPFRLDVLNQQLWRDTEVIAVRPKPFAVLAYLATHAGRLVPRAELVKAVWPDTYVSEGVLRGYIREVRVVLGDDPEVPRFIETVPRRGYRFVAAITAAPVPSSEFRVQSSPPPPAPNPQPLTPTLVGREAELMHLHQWVTKALEGARQVVFVTGEPGIGKTTLVDAFLHDLESARVQSPESQGREEENQKSKGKNQKPVLSAVEGAKIGDSSPAPSPQPLIPVLIGRGQCIEHYGGGEAYLPVLEALGQLCRQPKGERVIALLSRYAPTWLVQMPALMSDAELEAVQRKVQGATRERMLREMAEMIEALTAEQPLVLVLEDLHWSDYSTLDLFSSLARHRGPARLLLLGTYRPADVIVRGHPLRAMKQELQVHGQSEELLLGFLTAAEVTQYLVVRFPQQEFPHALEQIIHQSTEGNPLFMANVVDDWVRQGVLVETDGQWKLAAKVEELAAGVPETLRQTIERQLEQLTPEERRMVEAASVVGGEFLTAAVAAGVEEEEEHVEEWCEELAKRDQFVRARGMETLVEGTVTGRYGFVHALYQQVLYERVAAARRIYLHRRIGEWEEGVYGVQVSEVAAELAMHFERGQDYARAVRYLMQAGENALRRSAPREAIDLLAKGLELLQTLPDTPERLQQKLALQIALGIPLVMTKGYAAPEVESVYTQARELCRQIGETPLLFPVLFGLFRFYYARAQYTTAHELAQQLMRLAQAAQDPIFLLGAHFALGSALFYLGETDAAEAHTQQGFALYNPQQHGASLRLYGQDLGVVSRAQGAVAPWLLGYPDQALQRAHDALALAQRLSYPFSVAFASLFVAVMHQLRRESRAAAAQAEFTIGFTREQGFPFWLAMATITHGGELANQGNSQEGITQMRHGLATLRALGADIGSTYWVGLLAEQYGRPGRAAEGLDVLAEAFTLVEKNGERWWEAELYRLKGELTLQQASQKAKGKRQKSKVEIGLRSLPPDPQAEAEACFLKAIEIACRQQAKSLELRAVMSLVRLRHHQAQQHATRGTQHSIHAKFAESHQMLSKVYHWFTEGFDTPDLQEAKTLLQELSR